MKTVNQFFNLRLLAILFAAIIIASCSDDDNDGVEAPGEEDEVEVITNVTLIFTPVGGGTAVMATATDPDGEGIQPLIVDEDIVLEADTEYDLTFTILNALDPNDVEDIGEEIFEEDDEHQFFFEFTMGAFASPTGNGNIGTDGGNVNYDDLDDNDLPVGLETSWTTGPASTGTFRVQLQHQPPVNGNIVKTATSTSGDGDTDFNITFDLIIQ